jgi:hypothetical protein
MEATTTKTRSRKTAHTFSRNHNNIVASRSQSQLTDKALAEGIMPCFPVTDIFGYDAAMEYRGKFTRVQIRACGLPEGQPKLDKPPKSITFSIIRSKRKKRFKEESIYVRRRHFKPDEIDAFIFIHVDYGLIFIVPVDAIDLTKTKFTVHLNECWHNNWGILK